MPDIRISQLPAAGPITGAELVPIVQNGGTVQTTAAALAASPVLTQTFLTLSQEPTLDNSRYLSTGTGLGLTDGGAQSYYRITLNGTSGSLESASTGIIVKDSATTVTSRSIAVGTSGLSISNGSGIAGNPTISLDGLPLALASVSGTGLVAVLASSALTPVSILGTSNQIDVANGTAAGGASPTIGLANNAIMPGTGALTLPGGTEGQRPAGAVKQIRYNSTSDRYEAYYSADGWVDLGQGDGSVTSVSGTANQIAVLNGTTTPAISIVDNPSIPGSSAMRVPYGSTGDRTGAPANGMLRYNTDTATFEGYANNVWGSITTGTGVTSITAGTGLTGGTITSTGTIAIDTSVVVTLTGSQVLTNKTISGSNNTLSNIGNSSLTNSSVTYNGITVALGASGTITAANPNALTIGTGLSGTSYDGSSAVTIAIANTGVTANTYGSASAVPVFAVNAQGQVTSVTNTNISIASSAITDKGLANGVASLDGSGTVPTSQLPAAVLGALKYQGTWNASTNTPTLASGVGTQGYYYVVSVAGTTNLDGIASWAVGDWAIYSGTAWQKIDNTDAVTSVNGYTGTVVLTYTDVGAQPAGTYVTAVSGTAPVVSSGGTTPAISMAAASTSTDGYLTSTDWNTFNGKGSGDVVGPASSTDNAIARFDSTTGKLLQNSVVTVGDTGVVAGVTELTASTKVVSQYFDASGSGGGSLRNASGVAQLQWGGGGGNNITVDVATNINPTNANVSIAPTGTGSVTINPATAGTINNMSVGQTTAAAGKFTDFDVTGTFKLDSVEGTSGQVMIGAGVGSTPTWANQSSLSVGTATNANNVAITTGSATTNYLAFVTATTGNLPVLTNSGLTYNSSTNAITGGITGGTF